MKIMNGWMHAKVGWISRLMNWWDFAGGHHRTYRISYGDFQWPFNQTTTLTREYHVQNLSRSAGANWLEALLVTSMVTDFLAKQAQVIEFKVYTKHAGDINHRNLVYFIFVEQTATLEIDFLWSTARSWGWRELGPCFKVNFCEIVGIGHDHSTWKEVVRA